MEEQKTAEVVPVEPVVVPPAPVIAEPATSTAASLEHHEVIPVAPEVPVAPVTPVDEDEVPVIDEPVAETEPTDEPNVPTEETKPEALVVDSHLDPRR